MTAESSLESTGIDAGRVKRPWRPMTIEYVNDVGTIMKATHKSGMKGESDVFTVKRPD